jgi:hypothetical protein
MHNICKISGLSSIPKSSLISIIFLFAHIQYSDYVFLAKKIFNISIRDVACVINLNNLVACVIHFIIFIPSNKLYDKYKDIEGIMKHTGATTMSYKTRLSNKITYSCDRYCSLCI